jgi:hypothetical protein
MEALQILKNTLKKNGPLQFTRHLDLNRETKEFEAWLEEDEDHIVETDDAEEFGLNLSKISFVESVPVVSK